MKMFAASGWAVLLMMAPLLALAAPSKDPELDRIRASLTQLEAQPDTARDAASELARAREALRNLEVNKDKKLRAHLIHLAERRIEIARVIADAAKEEARLQQLRRDKDDILLRASRRDAEMARLEAEKLRLQNLARMEEAERLRQEAEAARIATEQATANTEAARAEADQQRRVAEAQAAEAELARREAELATAAMGEMQQQMQELRARRDARGLVMTLGEFAFAPGKAQLQPEVAANLDKVIEFVNRDPAKKIRIEGHTDSRGDAALNQKLSRQRADAVRAALTKKGVASARMVSIGMGEEQPIADNESETGRAKNRRVDIILLGAQ